jgi:hypothetical protein
VTNDTLPTIIRDMALPVVRARRTLRGVDLKPHGRALRQLLDEVWEEHDLAVRDWKLRGSPDKPRREWPKNQRAAAPRHDYSAYMSPDHEAQFLRDWAMHYEATYALPRANPGTSRENGLPLAPLACVYVLLRHWWQARALGWAWRPEFGADTSPKTKRQDHMNPSLRMLYLVARSCGPDYSVANCLSIHDRLKSLPRRANKAAKARAARKKAAPPRARKKTR